MESELIDNNGQNL